MAEIPVERKHHLPIWPFILGGLGLLALLAVFFWPRHATEEATTTTTTTTGAAAVVAAGKCQSDDDCADRQLCVSAACKAIEAGTAECAAAQVHFDTDSATVRAEDRGQLARMARCLKADQTLKLTVAGAADERGTEEHNEKLSEQRARTVSKALMAAGISPQQLRVVSYGDNRQLCGDSDEECWAKNRRVALVPK